MKIGDFKVKRNYKIIQIILDIVALAFLILSVATFFFKKEAIEIFNKTYLSSELNETGRMLSWYPLILWLLLLLLVLIISIFLTFKNRKLPKMIKLKETHAQEYYNILMTAISVIRLLFIYAIFDLMYIHAERIMGGNLSFLSSGFICSIILIIIMVFLLIGQIKSLPMRKLVEKKKNNRKTTKDEKIELKDN